MTCKQVALLFLTRGPMPLEPVWREFLSAAALIRPTADVRADSIPGASSDELMITMCLTALFAAAAAHAYVADTKTLHDEQGSAHSLRDGSDNGSSSSSSTGGRRQLLRLWRRRNRKEQQQPCAKRCHGAASFQRLLAHSTRLCICARQHFRRP